VGRATTFKEQDDPTGGGRMKDLSALNNREVQRHPESEDSVPREFTSKAPTDDEYRPSEVNKGEKKSKGQC